MAPWWTEAVFYQIYPRSFASSGTTGVGDLRGIEQRLDYLSWLGVDAVWLSPFYRSPMRDYGYDIADHCDVDPMFGTLDDADHLIVGCHERGLKLLVDYVPNHTSDEHPWFADARSSRDSARRDWYIWRDGSSDAPPNNWIAAFAPEPAWTWDRSTEQWYLHQFLPSQPDLNWDNPEVVSAMHDVLRFWLDRGVDGVRIDVMHGVGKDPELPNDPEHATTRGIPHATLNDVPRTHEIARDLRKLADAYPGDRVLLGEIYLLDTGKVATYYGQGDEMHLAFNFPPLYTGWDAARWRAQIDDVVTHIEGVGGWPTWVLSNHDNSRHRTRYGGSEDRARAATFLLLGLRGSPVMYAGEELGLLDAAIPPDRRLDPGGRDGSRAPIPWDGTPERGWGTRDGWLPWPPDADIRNAATLTEQPASILHLYRRLLAARRASPALRAGRFEWLDSPGGVLAWRRAVEGDERIVAVNMSGDEARIGLADMFVDVSSSEIREGDARFGGTLPGDHAVLLRPD